MPRTADEAGSQAYLARLNAACRKSYDKDPASAMRYAGEEVLVPLLQRAQEAGKTVFTVDYALQRENIAAAQNASRSFGFVPFVGARNLNTIIAAPQD